uniref:Uncharacterized protein n=1 Tax=Rheinheimera sp. BAL341 TaxID=1708203 RepID=A0A486XSW2_9GAMM
MRYWQLLLVTTFIIIAHYFLPGVVLSGSASQQDLFSSMVLQ